MHTGHKRLSRELISVFYFLFFLDSRSPLLPQMAAALNWIIKDGLGQLGGVVYASFVSDKFDSEPKRFRFQATVAMQGANVLELLTPLWPGSFLAIASISNIGKTHPQQRPCLVQAYLCNLGLSVYTRLLHTSS